jgi:hypothetical protein
MIMENYPSRALTDAWIYSACCTNPECKEAKLKALENIAKVFGNIEIARTYLTTFAWDIPKKSA